MIVPENIPLAAFVLGAVLLLVSLTTGGVKIFGAEVSGTAGRTTRTIAGVCGTLFIAIGLWSSFKPLTHENSSPLPERVSLPPTPAAKAYIDRSQSPLAGADGLLSQSIGLETLGGVFTPLLKVGCAVPCVATQTFSTADDAQASIQVSVYRGNTSQVAQATFLGTFEISGFKAASRGMPSVKIQFTAVADSIRLSATDGSTSRDLLINRIK